MFSLIAYVMQRNYWNLINPLQMTYRFTYKNIMARRSPFVVLFHRAFGLSIRGIFLLPLSLATRSLRQLKESKHHKKKFALIECLLRSHERRDSESPVEIGDVTSRSSSLFINIEYATHPSRLSYLIKLYVIESSNRTERGTTGDSLVFKTAV